MSKLPVPQNPWPPMLVMDLALGIDTIADILDRHQIDTHTWENLQSNLAFRRDCLMMRREVAESGASFKRKAALHAETYLEDMHELMRNPETPPNIRHDIFKTLAKLGGLEPKEKIDGQTGSQMPTFAIQINL